MQHLPKKSDMPFINGRLRSEQSPKYVPGPDAATVILKVDPDRVQALGVMAGHWRTSKQALLLLAIDRLFLEFREEGLGVRHE